jgi:hypothetical protein
MCKLEPAFVAVPNPLVVTLAFEGLLKGDKYLEEDLVWNATDCCPRRQLMIVGAVMTVG